MDRNNIRDVPLFDIIPLDILCTKVLGEFCTGKTISTFAVVLEGYYYSGNEANHKPFNKRQRFDTNGDNTTTETKVSTTTTSSAHNALFIVRHILLARYKRLLTLVRKRRQMYSSRGSSSNNEDRCTTTTDSTDDRKKDVHGTSCELEKGIRNYTFEYSNQITMSGKFKSFSYVGHY